MSFSLESLPAHKSYIDLKVYYSVDSTVVSYLAHYEFGLKSSVYF